MIITKTFSTPLGNMIAGATPRGLCLLEFTDRVEFDKQILSLKKYFQTDIIEGESPYLEKTMQQISEYFKGERKTFDIVFDIAGTEFQKEVWKELQNIPYGKTCSYVEQSENMNRKKSVRAVATANGNNKIAIIIPCHRVIGKNGSLSGYAGGIDRKKFLLDLES
ncbi:cysteine methyltransferase [Candidatus Peregrinibacteria bacterium]|nr:MAG: cysteine methyltransferase [Candidatus Peregrinibacteria bacterium]